MICKYFLQNKIAVFSLFFAFYFQLTMANAQVTYPVREPVSSNQVNSDAQLLGALGDRLIYLDIIGDQKKLWVSDGTAAGTYQISASEQTEISLIAMTGDVWYFKEKKGSTYHISSLSKGSDELVSLYGTSNSIKHAIYWNESIYFTVKYPTSFAEDLVKLVPATSSRQILFTSDFGGIRGIGATNTEVMFIASMDEGKMLGKTDGTVANTYTFRKLYEDGSEFSNAVFMQSNGEKMFFAYHPSNYPYYLWVSDGTSEGTMILKEYSQPSSGMPTNPFAVLDGKFYFILRKQGSPSGTTFDLHVSDGTAAGTINLNPFSSGYLHPRKLTIFGDKLYFTSLRDNWALMSTEGTVAGTKTVVSAYGYLSGGIGSVYDLGKYKNSLVFNAYSDALGDELYISDGTLSGTTLLSDINPGTGGSSPVQFTQVGELLFFLAYINDGRYLWAANPCAALTIDSVAVTNVVTPDLGTIEIVTSGGVGPLSYQLNGGTATSTPLFENLPADTYDILVTDLNGCTVDTQVVVQVETNVFQSDVVRYFQVYPNPVGAENLNINLVFASGLESVRVEIYDLFGKKILEQTDVPAFGNELTHQISTKGFPEGNYIISISSKAEKIAAGKFTVINSK
jgi:ELWxxDGT repeat protein